MPQINVASHQQTDRQMYHASKRWLKAEPKCQFYLRRLLGRLTPPRPPRPDLVESTVQQSNINVVKSSNLIYKRQRLVLSSSAEPGALQKPRASKLLVDPKPNDFTQAAMKIRLTQPKRNVAQLQQCVSSRATGDRSTISSNSADPSTVMPPFLLAPDRETAMHPVPSRAYVSCRLARSACSIFFL